MSNSTDQAAADIEQRFRSLVRSFPYDDCRYVIERGAEGAEGFIPSLGLHFSTIAGYASSAGRISRWSAERTRQAKYDLAVSFFDKHPNYRVLAGYIDAVATPQLFSDLEAYENLRVRLLGLL